MPTEKAERNEAASIAVLRDKRTLEDVASEHGISRARVRQVVNRWWRRNRGPTIEVHADTSYRSLSLSELRERF
jgi:DNA-directed RNA polymerase sigma subunit (sigma70/sigma32)